jgi:hypothetical protein
MRRFAMLAGLAAVSLLFSGCLRPIGSCTYGKNDVKTEQATIKKIEQENDDPYVTITVEVAGGLERHFTLSTENYQACLAGKGLAVGSSVALSTKLGGPCPPMERIAECPWQS